MIFERKINYYETDGMRVVHHSNYIRFLEEARCDMLEKMGVSYKTIEQEGLMIPVLEVKCEYKHPARFEDTIQIALKFKEFTGVKMTIAYEITNKEDGKLVVKAETKHCFTNAQLRPVHLKKVKPEWYEIFMEYSKE